MARERDRKERRKGRGKMDRWKESEVREDKMDIQRDKV